jgi:HTH-type transcriptional regulator / antitoxin HigA
VVLMNVFYMETKMKVIGGQKDYLELVQSLPLCIIEDKKYYEHALAVMKQLAIKDNWMSKGERQYFKVLSLLVGHYENEHFKIANIAPQDILRSLMSDHRLTQSAVAEIAGEYESNISAHLAGKRNLTKQAAKRLGEHFAVDPMLFLPSI